MAEISGEAKEELRCSFFGDESRDEITVMDRLFASFPLIRNC